MLRTKRQPTRRPHYHFFKKISSQNFLFIKYIVQYPKILYMNHNFMSQSFIQGTSSKDDEIFITFWDHFFSIIVNGVFLYRIPPYCGACTCVRNRGNGACTKSGSKVHFFYPSKNRAVSYISACLCRDPKISYQFGTIEWPILSLKHAFLGFF